VIGGDPRRGGDFKHRAARASARALRTLHPRFGLRSSDVLLASFPKSGSTWLRFLLANLVSLEELGGVEVDYEVLNGPLRAEYDLHWYPTFESKSLPRFVKTHRPFEPRRFGRNASCLILRHPGDVMVSYHAYRSAAQGRRRFVGDLSRFIRDEEVGLPAWRRHLESWWPVATHRVAYEALHTDGTGALRALLEAVGAPVPPPDVLDAAVERSSFDRIRAMEERRGLDTRTRRHLDPDFRFARRGAVGDWQGAFSADDRRYLEDLLREIPREIADEVGCLP